MSCELIHYLIHNLLNLLNGLIGTVHYQFLGLQDENLKLAGLYVIMVAKANIFWALYFWMTQFKVLILIPLKMIMVISLNRRWIIPFKKFRKLSGKVLGYGNKREL